MEVMILAKYGTFNYNSSVYGKTVTSGSADVSPYNSVRRHTGKFTGKANIVITGTITRIKTFLKNVGTGTVNVTSSAVKNICKVILSLISPTGNSIRTASLNMFIFGGLPSNGHVSKGLSVNVSNAELSIYAIMEKQASKSFHATVPSLSTLSRQTMKVISDLVSNISGGISTLKSFIRSVGTGQVSPSGIISKTVTYVRLVGNGIASATGLIAKIVKKFVGFSSSFTYGSFKYGEKKYTMSTWISGGVSKNTFHDTGSGTINIAGILKKMFFSIVGSGIISILHSLTKQIGKFPGKADMTIVGAFKKVGLFKRGTGNGNISISSILKRLNYYFIVTLDNILLPLGVRILRDSKQDIFPNVKENTEELPGRNGTINFDSKLGAKSFEFHVVSPNDNEMSIEQLRREYAGKLDPAKGTRALVFEQDEKKTYPVKYSGKISPQQYANWMDFSIPFKMSDPYIIGSYEEEIFGSGTAFNKGNAETPLRIVLTGPLTNPSITIGTNTLSYTGIIASGSSVEIETEECTAVLDGSTNVLNNITGELPYSLPSGSTDITANPQIKFYWRSRWI